MKTQNYNTILKNRANNKKMFVLLIDPEKHTETSLKRICELAEKSRPDFIFIGGSQIVGSIEKSVNIIKQETDIPIMLFPGHTSQLSSNIDSMLFLSLTSGRNSKYLIEHQIESARYIKEHNIEAIPTSYILIEGGQQSAVEIISNTRPYNPLTDIETITNTAIASELLGFKLIYLEAGSGASHPISKNIINTVKQNTTLPIIVGGGIKTIEDLNNALIGGADIIVVGNHFESHPEHLPEFTNYINQYNKKP